jgi:hypothetical protein
MNEVAHGIAHEPVELRLLGGVLFELREARNDIHKHRMRRKLGELTPHGDEGARHRNADLSGALALEHT